MTALGAVAAGVLLVMVDARDARQEPPTDLADAIATFAVLGGVIGWLMLRRIRTDSSWTHALTALLAGIVLGALLVGLASVLWDPFHR